MEKSSNPVGLNLHLSWKKKVMNMLEQLQTQFNRLEKDDSLSSFRSLSWQKFCEMGLPTKSHEAFRYVSLRDLYMPLLKPDGSGNRSLRCQFA